MAHTIKGWDKSGKTVEITFTDYEIRDEHGNKIAEYNEPAVSAKAWKKIQTPVKRINFANVGRVFHLGFHSPYTPVDEDHTLIKLEGKGDDARATFRDVSGMDWEAYRYNGRWVYGSSANRLEVLEVK